jgi:hypothetical protein
MGHAGCGLAGWDNGEPTHPVTPGLTRGPAAWAVEEARPRLEAGVTEVGGGPRRGKAASSDGAVEDELDRPPAGVAAGIG